MRNLYKQYFKSLYSVFVFLPYFFSVDLLVKNYFSPYHKVVVYTKTKLTNIIWGYVISSAIGIVLRTFLLVIFLIIMSLFVVLGFFVTIAMLILAPAVAFYTLFVTTSDNEETKKNTFIKQHLLDPQNTMAVEQWYFNYKISQNIKNSLHNKLFSIAPIAADWAYGYTPELIKYARDIHLTCANKIIFGRNKELSDIVFLLTKSTYSNVLLTGQQNTGKESIVELLAQKIALNQIHPSLRGHKIYELNIESLLELGDDKIKHIADKIFEECARAGNTILYLPNVTKYLQAQIKNNPFIFIFEQALKNNNLKVIATASDYDYEIYIKQKKLSSYFEHYAIGELDLAKTKDLILWQAHNIETKFNITITYEAIIETLDLAQNILSEELNPEKSVNLLTLACESCVKENLKTVLPANVAKALYLQTNIPLYVTQEHKNALINFESNLNQQILGQEKAIAKISQSLKSTIVDIGKTKKPICSFLFLGNTGVGKTQTAKYIFEGFFNANLNLHESKSAFIRVDCNELTLEDSLETLIGSSKKQTDSDFILKLKKYKSGVILFDELEKAHPNIIKSLLNLLDEGYIADFKNQKTYSTGYIIVATSNAAQDKLDGALGMDQITKILAKSSNFSYEFLNRFASVIVFEKLNTQTCLSIAHNYLQKIITQDKLGNITKSGLKELDKTLTANFSEELGAREVERIVKKFVNDQLVNIMLNK